MTGNRVLTVILSVALLGGVAATAGAQQAGAPQQLGQQPVPPPPAGTPPTPPGTPPSLTPPAQTQEEPQNGANPIGVTPLSPLSPQFAQPSVDLTPREALTGAPYELIKTQATLCTHVVMVDDEVHRWDALEGLGRASVGWAAYQQGNYTGAAPYFARMAKLGHPEAQRLMGVVYYFGQGVPQDYARALSWFEKAANQGCWTAYAATALMYRDGKGTGVDLGKAYMWLNIAIAGLPDSVERDDLIKGREAVAGLMTTAQVEAAQKRSLSFKAKPLVPPDPQDLPLDYFPKPVN
jgi:Sel1 repeat